MGSHPALMYDDAAAFSDQGDADGYDLGDIHEDAAALFYDLNADASGTGEDYGDRDVSDLYEEAAALVETANDNDLSQEWYEGRRSGDAAFFGKIIKKAKKAVSKAASAVSTVARTAAKVASPVTNLVNRAPGMGLLKKVTRIAAPMLPLAKTVASFVPGAGTAVAAALSAAESMAKGKSLEAIALDAARGALPGGPLAQMALDSAMRLAQGQSVTEAAIAAARSQIPAEAQTAFDIGIGAVLRDKARKAVAPPAIRRLGQRLLQGDARGLDLDEAAALCQCSPGDAADAIGSITGAVQRVARGGSPVLLREPALSQFVRGGKLSLDKAVTAFGSHVAPWQGRERRGVAIQARETRGGALRRVAAAFEPARYSPLTASETQRLMGVPAVRNMPRGALIRMVTGADARGITPDGGYYIVESSDYGLQQIATKLGHPGDGWKELRNANLAPLGAQKKQASNGSFTTLNPGDKLELPAGWKTVPAAPPPPAPPTSTPPVSITVPGVGPVPVPPLPPIGGGGGGGGGGVAAPPGLSGYKRSADGGALPAGARLGQGATKIAHLLSNGEYPSELAKRYARPSPDTAWRDLRGSNPTKKLNADGTFAVWGAGETVNIPDTWVTSGAADGDDDGGITAPPKVGPVVLPPPPKPPVIGGGTTPPIPPLPTPPVVPVVTPPAPPAPPKIDDVLPTPPKNQPPGPGGGYTGGGGEGGGGGSSDYWKGYTAEGAVQAKAMLIRYLVEDAKTQTSPPLGTQTIDTTALWDQRAQEATRIFQKAHGLITTGTPDDVTYQALRAWNQAFATPGTGGGTPTPTTTPAKTGGGGDAILPLIIAAAGALLLK